MLIAAPGTSETKWAQRGAERERREENNRASGIEGRSNGKKRRKSERRKGKEM
jgi:hypothetical protein